jgi:hypothetical protein
MSASLDFRTFLLTSNFAGGVIEKWQTHRYSTGTTDHAAEILYCNGISFINCMSGIIQYARSTGYPFQVTQSSNMVFQNCVSFNGPLQFTTCFDCSVSNHDHTDRYVSVTTTATGVYAISCLSSCDNIVVDGVTFGMNGAIANCHPYLGVFNAGLSKNIKFRNLGTRSSYANGGGASNPAYIFVSSGNNQNIKVQRCYMTPTRTGAVSTINSDKGNIYEHVYGDMADTMVLAGLNETAKNCGGTNTTTGQASVYGTHFWDSFTSDTAGRVILSLNEPTSDTLSTVTTVAGTPKFTSAGGLVMASVNDEIIIEQHYFVKGCTALTNTAPIVTGTNVTYVSGPDWGNHDIYYQIDTGSGYGGSWKDLTATNLSGETINAATGFKVKYRIVCDTASTTNLISYIRIATTSTLASQTSNLYDLDVNTVTFTGLQTGSDVFIYEAGTTTVLGSVDANGTSSWGYTYSGADTIDVGVFKAGYIPFYIRNLSLTTTDSSIPVAQVIDRAYLT